MSQVWETLVATALMGTDRKTPDLSGVTDELGDMLAQLQAADVNHQLLGAASAIAISNQAGLQAAGFSETLPEPCPEETQPLCHESIHGLLAMLIGGTHRYVLPDLLTLLASSGQRVSMQSIPMLLKLGRNRSELRDRIRAVIGNRGQWLAQQNPAWSYMSGVLTGIDDSGQIDQAKVTEQWDTETQATRLALLQELRELDADFARELLASSWTQEKAKDRAEFLSCLHSQLSDADEEFLESALSDRGKEVRTLALALLAHLPTSKLCQRMTERVQELISIQPKSKKSKKALELTITLPKTDETNDGLVAVKTLGLGQRSSLLIQIVGAVPLSYWEDEPEALIAATKDQDNQAAVLKGWQTATIRQQNQTWGKALIDYYHNDASKAATNLTDLAKILPQAERETYFREWLALFCQRKEWADWRKSIPSVVQANPNPSLDFSQSLLKLFQKDIKADLDRKKKSYPYHLRSLTHDLGYYIDPESSADAQAIVNQLNPDSLNDSYQHLLEDLLEILRFRQSVTQLFTDS